MNTMMWGSRRVRSATLPIVLLLTLANRAVAIDPQLQFIPAADVQTGGPDYDFRIGVYEIRNDEFVEFLNDAMANLDNERGQFMYFDLDSGDVYIHNAVTGVTGLDGSATLFFDASANGNVSFNAGQYSVDNPAYDAHPATGVSWYGAVKFCNWLTLERGLPSVERCYTEAPSTDLNGWHPVTISTADWSTRDLNDTERVALLAKLGFRLPMAGLNPGSYNEWFKAASARDDGLGGVAFDALYGFGRDAIGPEDGNFFASADPFEPGTTPVGFYDGVNLLGDGSTLTADTGNGYGLYDLSGNVWEWMQDQDTSQDQRGNRGGSFRSSMSTLWVGTMGRRLAEATVDSTGFRLVQSVPAALQVIPDSDLISSGLWGGPYDDPQSDQMPYTIMNFGGEAGTFVATVDALWVTISPDTATVDPGSSVVVTVSIDPSCADGLILGENLAIVSFEDLADQTVTERTVRWTVREPLDISPTTDFNTSMAFGRAPVPPNAIYLVDNASDQTVSWSASWTETTPTPSGSVWLTVTPTGDVQPQGIMAITTQIDTAVAATLAPGTYTADVRIVDECTSETFTRTATLTVLAPFDVTPSDPVESSGVSGTAFDPPFHEYTITNLLDATVTWTVSLCEEAPGTGLCTPPAQPSWLELDVVGGTTFGNDVTTVTASISAGAAALDPGTYPLTLRFEEPDTGYLIERLVTLNVTSLLVTPSDPVAFSGPLAGPFQPASQVFELQNSGPSEMSWQAVVAVDPGSGLNWLTVEPSFGVILDPVGSDTTEAKLTADAILLPPGTYEGIITFAADGANAERVVTLVVGGEAFSVPMVIVPATDVQPAGPDYDLRIGIYEITNNEYARFLNDTLRHKTDARGRFLYHDTDSGSVYINDMMDGVEGTGAPSATVSTLIYDAAKGRIGFDATRIEPYFVEAGFARHPVVGVSWYGAAKFCNWMTLVQGMPENARAYLEGPDVAAWGAVTSDPAGIAALAGFRLPMDDGTLTAAAYNEWYKAASRMGVDPDGDAVFGAVYGFGRDALAAEDANYLDNGDTETNGTTPIGFFDGVEALFSGALSRDTDNGYGLYDLCGNVAEWVHELDGSAGTILGATRGGHFGLASTSSALKTDQRAELPADSTFDFVGFRVAQSLTPNELIVRQGADQVRADGFVGGPYVFNSPSQDGFTITLHNDGAYTLDDVSFSISSVGGWLVFDGIPPRQVPPGATVDLRLRSGDAVDNLLVSPEPTKRMRLVPGREVQQEGAATGPAYDYWISPTEVTNTEFAAFLNDALLDAEGASPGERSDYMYFDLGSGSVYINTEQTAGEGSNAPSVTLPSRLLYDASIGRIGFDGVAYSVETGFENHPVVGVSWYGALKYCNWLTLSKGLPSALRAYAEGVDPASWHPVTITTADWSVRDLSDDERRTLVRNTIGYRLPMDDGGNNTDLLFDAADDHNEWYKAATRRIDADGLAVFDAAYGFGRDVLTGADANFFQSGDTQADETTPVGFFDGVHLLLDGLTTTKETKNGYRLHDLTGNVAEWMQDWFVAGDTTTRTTRGGSWNDAALPGPGAPDPLSNVTRTEYPPAAVSSYTGFRVVRGTGHIASVTIRDRIAGASRTQYVLLDLREPLELEPLDDRWLAGPFCIDFGGVFADPYTLTNRSASDMPWSVDVDQDWVTLTQPVSGDLSGTIPGGVDGTVDILVEINSTANDLSPGEHTAVVTFRNTFTGQSFTREIQLNVEQPITVVPDDPVPTFEGFWQEAFENLSARTLTLSRCATCDGTCVLDYRVSTPESWLVLGPAENLAGPVPPPGQSTDVQVSVDATAATLAPGTYTGRVAFELTDATQGVLSGSLTRTIELVVKPPIEILEPSGETWNVDCEVDPASPPRRSFTLVNRHATSEIGVTVSVDVGWIDLAPSSPTLLPGQALSVNLSLTDQSIPVPGDYTVTITFQDSATGETQTRDLDLTVGGDFCVRPLQNIATAAPVGGTPVSGAAIYRLTNRLLNDPQTWSAATNPLSDWVLVGGVPADSAGGVLGPGESVDVLVSVDPVSLSALFNPTGPVEQVFTTALEFRVVGNPVPLTRTVTVTLVDPLLAIREGPVRAEPLETGGPGYSFVMGTFETTNEEFAVFLNDTLAMPDDPRGAYMYFDTDTGNVYVHSNQTGGSGARPGLLTTLLYNASIGRILYAPAGGYSVEAGFENHPVVGVSWYGAIKYCNWLTLDQGIGKDERCYTEAAASNLNAWHPVTITTSEWASCDLNDAQRAALLAYRGYRLPMDDGYDNAQPPLSDATSDAPDTYNEWYKAAAFNGADSHWAYGFGRSELNLADGVDANYAGAGLPFADTTPVGFFGIDGDRTWDDPAFGWGDPATPIVTVQATDNYYGLHDMTGNAYHWLQGRFGACGDTIDRRTLRGGKWAVADPRTLLATDRSFALPGATTTTIGFRVMRTISEPGDFDGSGNLDRRDYAAAAACLRGPGVTVIAGCEPFDIDGDGDCDLFDLSAFLERFTGGP